MIAVVVPTYRQELLEKTFIPAWAELFEKHNVEFLITHDNEDPKKILLEFYDGDYHGSEYEEAGEIMGKDIDLVYPKNAGTKLVAFHYIQKYLKNIEYILCLDDDVTPIGDPIQDHVDALNLKVPISWMGIADIYTRGVPYEVRDEAEVVLSHGVWDGVPDIDAPTQLLIGDKPEVNYYKMPIPKGVFYPMSEMNIAFKRKMIPYMYFAPTTDGFYGCDDIWAGIESKKVIDEKGWAAVTGYSKVYHERASNKYDILIKQGKYIKYNERFWKEDIYEPYFKMYKEKRLRWQKLNEQ